MVFQKHLPQAYSADALLDEMAEDIRGSFETRMEFRAYKSILTEKIYEFGLPEDVKREYDQTTTLLYSGNLTPELKKKRVNIQRRVSRLLGKLEMAVYGEPRKRCDEEEDEDEEDEDDEPSFAFLGRRSSSGIPMRDLYETPVEVTNEFIEVFGKNIGHSALIYCPCNGNGAMSNVLVSYGDRNNLNWRFILKDLYTGDKEDYLLAPEYDYDFLIENPPWGASVMPFLLKAYESKKPFAFLLSIEVLSYKKTNALLTEKGACIYLIVGRPNFLHDGRSVQVGSLIWVIG